MLETATAHGRLRVRGARRRAVYIAVAVAVAAVGVELAVRVVHAVTPLYEDKTSLYLAHPLVHHWHKANTTGRNRAVTGEFDIAVRTNAHGMIGPDVSACAPQDVRRVAMMGDSFVEGIQVPEADSLVRRLEHHLVSRSGNRWQALNFGCSSFSPGLQHATLINVASAFEPHAVVSLFNFADVTDDARYAHCAVRDEHGRLIGFDGTKDKSALYRFAERSRALRTFVQTVKRWKRGSAAARREDYPPLSESYLAMFKPEYDEQDRRAWSVSLTHIEQMHSWARRRNVAFLLVALPMLPQVEPPPADAEARFRLPAAADNTNMQDTLRAWASAHDVAFLDLLPAAQEFKRQHPDTLIFYPLDQHLTKAGNDMAAAAIAAHVAKLHDD